MSSQAGIEKCFEDAEDSGILKVVHKALKCFPNFVDDYDLVDVLTVDISKNRFVELPQEILLFVMVEKIICSNNFLKNLPDLSNLNALTHLDVSQNQLATIPIHICSLPLKILKAAHNHLTTIPCEIGLLSKLQAMDVSCNELTNLPSTMGDLASLRLLNVRRNHIVALPDELSKLKSLCSLNFSCNRISTIPPAFRLISSLIELDLTNNPLTSPPAQICLKGRLHIVKYLSMAAQQQEKRWSVIKDKTNRSPSSSSVTSNSAIERMSISDRLDNYEALTNGTPNTTENNAEEMVEKDTVDSPKSEIAIRENYEIPMKPDTLAQQPDSNKDKQKILQEKGKLTPQFKTRMLTPTFPTSDSQTAAAVTSPTLATMSLDRSAIRSVGSQMKSKDTEKSRSADMKLTGEKISNIAARKEQLLKNKEEIIKSRQRLELIKSKSVQRDNLSPGEKPETLSPMSTSSQTSTDSNQTGEVVFEGIHKRGSLPKPRSNKILKDGASSYTMRRIYDVAKEEFEQLEKLREAMESKLRIKLPDDLPASLSDGIVLCHLVNHLRKETIPVIHVPSSGVPKLTMPKCQMNVDAFLDACKRIGVEKVDLCTAPDILEEKSPIKLCRTVEALMQVMGVVPPQINLAKSTTPR